MKKLILAVIALLVFGVAPAQEVKYCGQTEKTEALFARFPHLCHDAEDAERALEDETRAYNDSRGSRDQLYIIPVVFHIIHNNGPENISDEQVYSAMEVLNRDFRMLNEDISQVFGDFGSIAADIEIEFRLAQRDPDGNCTKGIVRVQSVLTNEGDSQMKQLSYWPRNKYMNVWVCADAGGAAGYTFLPSSVNNNNMATQDGIVLLHDYTGNIGTSNNFRSRTLTHECGHWLNLRHTWGPTNSPGDPTNCDFDDNVDDTPETVGWLSCLLDGESCGTVDNVQNYMEYSYCSRMFTEGQKSRMRAAIISSTAQRNQLWTETNLIATGTFNDEQILCAADFTVERQVICAGESVQFSDQSFHGVNSWSWDFGNGETLAGTDESLQNPVVTFNEPGEYTVTLEVGNGVETAATTQQAFITVLPNDVIAMPFVDSFEPGIDENTWFVTNPGNNVTWESTSSASITESSSIRIRNNSNNIDMDLDGLTSSTFDMSEFALVTISYKWAFAQRTTETDDRLRVSVSNDCGETWFLRKMHRGFTDLPSADPTNANFVPDANEWKSNTFTVDDPAYLVEGFRMRFEFEARGGNHIYLEDINIQGFTAADLSVGGFGQEIGFTVFPNPTSSDARVSYNLLQNGNVRLSIVDAVGQLSQVLFEGNVAAGEHNVDIDSSKFAAGIYFVSLELNGRKTVKRLVIQ